MARSEEEIKAYRREYYQKNKERIKEQRKGYESTRPARELELERERRYRARHPKRHLCFAARNRAAKKQVPFDLTEHDFEIPEVCPYLGIPLVRNTGGKSNAFNSPTLDRIVPELGYVKGNVEVVSLLANAMKQNATPEQLVSFATEVLRRHG